MKKFTIPLLWLSFSCLFFVETSIVFLKKKKHLVRGVDDNTILAVHSLLLGSFFLFESIASCIRTKKRAVLITNEYTNYS